MNKAIIFDSSTLISFAMNGLYEEIRKLKGIFQGKFLITQEVKKEVIDVPIKINRFKFEALKIKSLLEDKTLEMPSSLKISDGDISKKTLEVLNIINSAFRGDHKNIHLIDSGEASCLVLSKILADKGIDNVIAVDERTTRMAVEKPENLRIFLEKKLHTQIKADIEKIKRFGEFKLIRSTELGYILCKKGLLKLKNGVIESLLYALKFKGASISDDEIREMKNLS